MLLLPGGVLIIFKISTALAKEMVFSTAAKSVAPGFFQAGRQWLVDSITSKQLASQNTSSENDETEGQLTTRLRLQEERETAASTEYLVYNWLEALFAWFQVIVLWHEPFVSICALSGLFISFLMLTYFAPRIYATIMIVLFIYNANKFWFRHVWPTIRVPPGNEREEEMRLDVDRWTYLHPHLMTLGELGYYLKNLTQICELSVRRLMKLRRERPAYFCSIICSILSVTAYIGNRISGISLLFLSTSFLVSAPAIYLHLLPNSVKDWVRQNIALRIISELNNLSRLEQDKEEENEIKAAPLIPFLEKSPQTIGREASQSLSTLTTTAAKSIESQALSLFEHFRRKSFMNRAESDEAGKAAKAQTTDQPLSDQDVDEKPSIQEHTRPIATTEPETITGSQRLGDIERRVSEDMSSNNSVSLIDSDDDEGGFVML